MNIPRNEYPRPQLVRNDWKNLNGEWDFEIDNALADVLLDNEAIMGLCYTQLYDVEQEENGLMTYDRRFKFTPDIFYKINTRKAKNED